MEKKLQNNYTTPAQSRKLMELGIPDWTADCYYYEEGSIADDSYPAVVPFDELYEDSSTETMFSSYVCLPCWSVGRLIEISRTCTTLPDEEWMFPFWKDVQDNVEWAIKVIESAVRTEHIDFSKLNEL